MTRPISDLAARGWHEKQESVAATTLDHDDIDRLAEVIISKSASMSANLK